MKLKLFTLTALSLIATLSWGQTLLYNDGATIKIQSGATLYVEGGVHSTATATIDNDGTLEIKGDFTNLGTWEPSQPNTLKFSGNTVSNVNSAATVAYQDVVVGKSGANVVLASHMTVNDSLVFSGAGVSILETGNFDLKLGNTAVTGGYDADEYVATNGTGMMQKGVTANGTFEFPIGDIANYSPLTSAYTGTGYTTATIRARANDLTHPNKPTDATEYISRYWDVDAAGITGYSNTLTGTYVASDLTLGTGGTAAQVKGAVYDGVEWSYLNASTAGSTVTGTTEDLVADFTGTNFFGKVNLIAFLQGAYNTTTGVMSTTLTSNATIAAQMLNSPYTDAPASVASIPAGVTDWVKLELRDPANPLTVFGKKSAFIKSNGSIVDLDGTSFPAIKNGQPTSIVAIVHRTHLSIRTPNTGIDVVNPVLYDFSASLTNAYDNPANSINDAMKFIAATNDYIMWAGNGNSNTVTRYNGPANDRDYLLGTILGGNTGGVILNTYSTGDYNMNGTVRYNGPSNDRDFLLGTILLGNTGGVLTQHF